MCADIMINIVSDNQLIYCIWCGASDTIINVGNRASHWCVIE